LVTSKSKSGLFTRLASNLSSWLWKPPISAKSEAAQPANCTANSVNSEVQPERIQVREPESSAAAAEAKPHSPWTLVSRGCVSFEELSVPSFLRDALPPIKYISVRWGDRLLVLGEPENAIFEVILSSIQKKKN
jgi:hypothetical protein